MPKKNDDDEEEVTRRLGGGRRMPAPTMNFGSVIPSQSTAEHTWNLQIVPTLPEFYTLERTAVFVADTSGETIASRIAKVLRERSIETSYDDAKGQMHQY